MLVDDLYGIWCRDGVCVNERWVGLIECVWCGGDSVYIWEGANLRWFMNFSVCMYGGGVCGSDDSV